MSPAPADRALRLVEILEEEARAIRGQRPSGGVPAREAQLDSLETFLILEFDRLTTKLRQLRDQSALLRDGVLQSGTDGNLPAIASSASAQASMKQDLPYLKLAAWSAQTDVREESGNAASPETLPATEPSRERIATVLREKLQLDLPVVEPWLADASLRPYTRGLLERNLASRSTFPNPFAKTEQKVDLLLNRLLLEDAFAEHVERMDDARLREHFKLTLEQRNAALCLSGGGIRSATFALGVVQGLARHGVLDRFQYLSTVSGGGYLGGWFSAWSHHQGFSCAIDQLSADPQTPLVPEAAPVRHLREYSNYLSPRVGLMSADTWTLVSTFLRNLLLVWLVLVPLLAAVVAIPWLAASLAAMPAADLVAPARPVVLIALTVVAGLFAMQGVRFVHTYRPETGAIPAPSRMVATLRDQGAFLRSCLLPLSLATLAFSIAWRWFDSWGRTGSGTLASMRASLFESDSVALSLTSTGVLWFMTGAAAIHLLGWLAALRSRPYRRIPGGLLGEAVAIIGTGAAAGWLLLASASLLGRGAGASAPASLYATFAMPAFLTTIALAGFAFEGLMSRRTDDAEREWTARYSAWLLIVVFGWVAFMLIVLFGPHLMIKLGPELGPAITGATGLGAGALTALLGRSAKTSSTAEKSSTGNSGGKLDLRRVVFNAGLPVIAAVAAVMVLVALSMLDMGLIRFFCGKAPGALCGTELPRFTVAAIESLPPFVPFVVLTVLTLAGLAFAWAVDTNKFSLHAMYRARLIRAYLGASRPQNERRPDPFTGFDDKDNIPMGCVREPRTKGDRAHGKDADPKKAPFHVVNVALNLVGGRNLAWQERKADTFTVTPLHAGALRLGYRRTALKGATCPTPAEDPLYYGGKKGITLGTAITISGAAASPNMGYHSSPAITFLMTLFNVRLGWWLGNPGPAGDDTYHMSSPKLAVRPIIDELFGATNETNKYVYLSDGGHFENLGLYEMVLRRNRLIVVSDASCDEKCSLKDLGNAVRKIRVDFGIPIDFPDEFAIHARTDTPDPNRPYWALGRIRYSCVDSPTVDDADRWKTDGILLYIKPGVYGGEPGDVFNYAAENPAFPHESTADQFFSESQFESYRALGRHVVETINERIPLAQLFDKEWQSKQLRYWDRDRGVAGGNYPTPSMGVSRV